MIRVAVCDDERDEVEKVTHLIEKFGSDNSVEFRITKYYDGEALINDEAELDIIFLDIEMRVLNGIETAKKIRLYNMTVPIIYITNYTQYWRNAYQVHAFGYIEKPVNYKAIHKLLTDFLRAREPVVHDTVCLTQIDGQTVMQDTNSIYCFLLQQPIGKRKELNVYTVKRNFIVKESINEIYNALDHDIFFMSHRSCIINLKYVENIKSYDIILRNGEYVPVAERKKKALMEALHKYLRNARIKEEVIQYE